RIREELEKLWLSPYKEKMPLLWESGLLAQIDPILSARLIARSQTITDEISACPRDALLRWCIVLQDYTPDEAKNFLKGMKFDNHTLKRVTLLLEQLKNDVPTEAYPLRKLAGNIGEDAMRELLTVQSILRPDSAHAESKALFEKILADGDCLTLKTMELSGKDLMSMGAPHGKVLGEVLAELLDMVLQKPEKNTKEVLSEKAQSILKEKGLL
ncbi:MAG: hypothetical protein IKT48_03575, partial [Anaerotignum sp.]|nr:hypothetical protein [Anaerotignum sp.]